MFDSFPRYEEFAPLVPAWCVTPDRPRCIHRFFDTPPISPSGRYLAVFQLPFEDRQPEPGEQGTICLIDLRTGKNRVVATSCGWEPQMGANLNWGGSDHELFFNDMDTTTWTPFAWKVDPLSGERERMEGTVYHASADGRWLISANLTTMGKTQGGYGVRIPPDKVNRNIGAVAEDGFYLTNTATGKSCLIASIADILENSDPPVWVEDPHLQEIYGFHAKFNPQGDRMMLSLRWYPASDGESNGTNPSRKKRTRFAWITMGLNGEKKHCAIGPDQWKKGGHHATWFPDGRRISMNLDIDRKGMRFVQVNEDGTGLEKMLDDVMGSGHPTVDFAQRHLLTDAYTWEEFAYGDGTTPLRWIDLKTGQEKTILRIKTEQPCADGVLRVDPHPAWDRTWRYITFNAFVKGTRRVFIADMGGLTSPLN